MPRRRIPLFVSGFSENDFAEKVSQGFPIPFLHLARERSERQECRTEDANETSVDQWNTRRTAIQSEENQHRGQ